VAPQPRVQSAVTTAVRFELCRGKNPACNVDRCCMVVACEWMRAPSIGRRISGKDTRSVYRWVNPIGAGPAPILTETGAVDHIHCLPCWAPSAWKRLLATRPTTMMLRITNRM